MAYQSEIEKLEKQYHANPDQNFAPYAEALRKAGDLDLAVDVLRAGLTKRPNYLSAHIVLGRCLVDQKNDPEAAKVFEQVLALDAENIIALRFLAELTERGGDHSGALRWLRRLLEVDPMNDDAKEALQRLEAAAPAAPVASAAAEATEAAEPAAEPAGMDDPAAVSGFEPTTMEPAPMGPPEGHGAPNDFGIEQSSSPFDTDNAGKPDMSALQVESNEIAFGEEQVVGAGASLDIQQPESRTVDLDAVPAAAPAPEEPPPSYEPPMLALESTPPEPPRQSLVMIPLDAEPEPAADSATPDGPPQELPLIMPEELDAAAAAEPAAAATPAADVEPEPVITETMAEVYVRQGLIAEAREVYRKLVERRPHDQALRDKLTALERQRATPPRGAPESAPGRPRFAAADTGGMSARSLFGKVLSSRPGAPAPEPAPPDASPSSPSSIEASPSSTSSMMEAAFADDAPASPGAPTRPTSDELSLAEVFGEDPASPPPARKPDANPAPAPGTPGFSFDEFFGGKPAEQGGGEHAGAPPADIESGSSDDFLSWLKGLKS